jgi:hypothetical protein
MFKFVWERGATLLSNRPVYRPSDRQTDRSRKRIGILQDYGLPLGRDLNADGTVDVLSTQLEEVTE